MWDEDLKPAVVMVHGLWMTGLEMGLLGRRLQGFGFSCYRFPYSSLRQTPVNNADALAAFVTDLARRHPLVHLLGHSLGGRVIELTLSRHFLPAPGRVLTLATPFGGSHIAHRLARRNWTRMMLGASAPALLTPLSRWHHQRPLGIIAGDLGIGVGLFFPGLTKPHDGTVALEETVIKGATARFTVHATHMSMLFSREVATLASAFFQTGAFVANPAKTPQTVVNPAPGAVCRRNGK